MIVFIQILFNIKFRYRIKNSLHYKIGNKTNVSQKAVFRHENIVQNRTLRR